MKSEAIAHMFTYCNQAVGLPPFWNGLIQLEVCPDATLDEGIREQICQAINRPEARAVCWDNDR